MDGTQLSAGPKLQAATGKARADFLARLDEVKQAAREWGVSPEHPEGVFISAMLATQAGFGELALAAGEDMQAVMADIVERDGEAVAGVVASGMVLAEAEVAKLREARLAAEAALKQAQTSLRTLEIQKVTLTSEMVKVIAPGLRDELRQAVVIKERRRNRNVEWGRAAAAGTVVLGLVTGGYVLGTWDDRAMTAAVEQCELHPLQDTKTGQRYCPLEALLAR